MGFFLADLLTGQSAPSRFAPVSGKKWGEVLASPVEWCAGMFRGQFAHTIDAKGRVSLPARFRDGLVAQGDPRFILTPALFDPCLHLYPLRGWEELEEKLAGLPSFDPNIVRDITPA